YCDFSVVCCSVFVFLFFFFFFQAEDGIRDLTVTGVQTCALPILSFRRRYTISLARLGLRAGDIVYLRLNDIDWKDTSIQVCGKRSEERRVGKECRSRWWAED